MIQKSDITSKQTQENTFHDNTPHKYMAMDYGLKRVGIAFSEASTRFVFPLCTLDRSIKKNFYGALQKLVEEYKPTAFVLGLPLRTDGTEGLTTAQVRNFAASLARRYPLPIFFINEFLSSFEAEEDLRAIAQVDHKKMNNQKIKKILDQQAAVRILQSFLEKIYLEQAFTTQIENKDVYEKSL